MAAAWASAGATPFIDAWEGAAAPSDFATDFVPAARRWRGAPARVDVRAGNAEAAAWGAPPYAEVGVPFGAHPPTAVLLIAALVPLGFRTAAVAWLLLSLAGLALLAWTLAGVPTVAPGRRRATMAVAAFTGLLLWPPVLHDIEKGQWSLVIAGLLAGAWWGVSRRRDGWAGALIATAGVFKVMPLLVLVGLVGRPSRRAAMRAAAITLVLAVAASAIVLGPGAWRDFAVATPANTRGWQTGPANTLSIWGLLARFVVGGPYARSWFSPPGQVWLARGVWVIVAGSLAASTLHVTLRAAANRVERVGVPPAAAPAFAAWSLLAVILGPLSWSHTAAWLVLPAALLAWPSPPLGEPDALTVGAQPSGGGVGRPPWQALAVAMILLTVPRATLFHLAGPWPVSPARGLFLSTHLVAALILLAVARGRLSALARTAYGNVTH